MNTKNLFKYISIVVLLVITLATGIKIHFTSNISGISALLLQNIEALASSKEASGLISNFKSDTFWYNADIAGGIAVSKEPGFWVSGTWKSMVCCGPGTDMDGCNFSMEDSECQRRVQRPAH